MTEIQSVFRLKLPEDQGDVCLTADGLRSVRAKIDKAIGVQLPDRCPPGVPADVWFKHQDLMADQRARRLEQEAANDRLRGKTDAETAQNIVTALNTLVVSPGDVFGEPQLTWKAGQGLPDPRVRVWARPSFFYPGKAITLTNEGAGAYRFRVPGSTEGSVIGEDRLTKSWLGSEMWTERERFPAQEPKLMFVMTESAPEPDPRVRVWETDATRAWTGSGKHTITVHKTPGGPVYKHSYRNGGPTDWRSLVKWSISDRVWAERERFAEDEG